MRRLTFAAPLVALLLIAGPASAGTPTENVLLVVLDDWGVDWFGVYDESRRCTGTAIGCETDADCMGAQTCDADHPVTPTFDSIATNGLVFRNAWANPVCSPTRASFLTGRHGFRTTVTDAEAPNNRLPAGELTLAEVLQDPTLGSPAGHVPAVIGKWHLGGGANAPLTQGFAHHAGLLGGGVADYFDWGRTVDGVTDTCAPGSAACPGESYTTTVFVEDALAWLSGQTGPWMLYVAMNAPHDPFQVPPHGLLSAATLARMPLVGGNPAPAGTVCQGPFVDDCYLAMIEAADAELGRLLATITDPTHVILMGDNGTPNRAVRAPFQNDEAKGSLYEGGLNVPMAIRHAGGLGAGTETDALVHAVDLFPTILELTGACAPMDRVIDGVSLVPLLEDPNRSWSERVHGMRLTGRAARDERFKLHRDAGIELFFDLTGDLPTTPADPFEDVDLLLGSCSVSGTDCHLDSECPMPETCDVAPLSPDAAAGLASLRDYLDALTDGAGSVPDGSDMSQALRVTKGAGGQLDLSWGPSCSVEDADYTLHVGDIGTDVRGHAPVACSTSGATTTSITDAPGSHYFLVVPVSANAEGSYGRSSFGQERTASAAACLPQLVRPCPWTGCD